MWSILYIYHSLLFLCFWLVQCPIEGTVDALTLREGVFLHSLVDLLFAHSQTVQLAVWGRIQTMTRSMEHHIRGAVTKFGLFNLNFLTAWCEIIQTACLTLTYPRLLHVHVYSLSVWPLKLLSMAVQRYLTTPPYSTYIVYCSFSHCSFINSGRIVLMSLSIVRNSILTSVKLLPACWRDFCASLIRVPSNLALLIILCVNVGEGGGGGEKIKDHGFYWHMSIRGLYMKPIVC